MWVSGLKIFFFVLGDHLKNRKIWWFPRLETFSFFVFGDYRKTRRNLWTAKKMRLNYTFFIWQGVNEAKTLKDGGKLYFFGG